MTSRASIWGAGLVASGLAHAAMAGALVFSLRPDDLVKQPTPQSSLTMAAQRLNRSQAIPQQPEGEAAAEADPQQEGLAANPLPQSEARPAEPQPQALASSPPSPASVPAAAPAQSAAIAQAPPAAQPIASAQVKPAAVASLSPEITPSISTTPSADVALAATDLPPARLAPAAEPSLDVKTAAPAAQPIAQFAPDTAPVPQASPSVDAAQTLPPKATVLPTAVPQSDQVTAALAFQGGAPDGIDPVSLAAFQSFMAPTAAASDGNSLRDGLLGSLAAVPCSRLQVAFDPDTATLSLRGHIPEDGMRAPVLAALQAQMGQDITVSDQMRLLPRPQCGALAGIGEVGLPQSTDQITNPLLVGDDAHARVLSYAGGDRLFFDLTAPDYPAYVYVDYFDAGGQVLHLVPNETIALQQTPAKDPLRVGAREDGDPGLQIAVGPPYGQEIAVAFAASHPLYSGLRPISEPAEPYLAWLRERVTEAREQHTDFKGEWVYFLVTTHAP